MRNIYIIVLSCVGAGCLFLTGCNDDFLQQDPLVSLTESTSLRSELELEYYLNQFYSAYMPGHLNGWGDSRTAPFYEVIGPWLMYGDAFSDNLVKTGGAYSRMNQSYQTPNGDGNTAWNWENIRKLNYFIAYYKQAEGSVSDPTQLDKWLAEAYFFKAWDYYQKVALFGDVPWLDKPLSTDSEEMYNARDKREDVMEKVLEMIDYAVENAIDEKNPTGRINKDQANFLKARICLYEGTYRKYHTELGLQSTASEWLRECETAAKAIMDTGRYGLYTGNTRGYGTYWELFTLKGVNGADHAEAIRARIYDGANSSKGHSSQRYYEQNNSNRVAKGMSKSAMDEYLCVDGQPISSSALFKGYDGMWTEMENRDPRLGQTVAKPGTFQTISSTGSGVMDAATYGIIYPDIRYNTSGSTVSGYMIAKHFMADKAEYDGGAAPGQGTQTALIFRYAECLLMYAEAKAELGTITNEDLDLTVNALRERAGFNFTTYPNAKLTLSNIPTDDRLDRIYAEKLDYSVSPIIREIRRERRVEMFMEGLRYEDLMRWKAGKLLTVPSRGMKMTAEKQALYATAKTFDKSKPLSLTNCTVANPAIINSTYYLDADGFIVAFPRDTYLGIGNGVLPWGDYRYYWPIPINQLTLNENLTQNDGWMGL